MLRILKTLGLSNLNSYSSTERTGVKGKSFVDITVMFGRKIIYFVESNCHFMLFMEGNMVSAVEYVSCIQKYRLSTAVIAISVDRIILLFLLFLELLFIWV